MCWVQDESWKKKHLYVSVLGTGWIMKKTPLCECVGHRVDHENPTNIYVDGLLYKGIQTHLLTYAWFESPPLFLSSIISL